MMKILFLSDTFPPDIGGGAGEVVLTLARGFKERGHDVYVITTIRKKRPASYYENKDGLKVYNIFANYHERWRGYLSLYNPQTITRVKKILNEVRPDVIHAHNIHYYLSYYCLKLARQSGAKVFITAHDVMLFHYGKLVEFIDPKNSSCENKNYRVSAWQQIKRFKKRYNPLRNIIIRHYLKYVDKIFAVSYTLQEVLSQNGIKNVEVVHNGVDISGWQIGEEQINEFKEKYYLKDKKIVLFGGRLSEAKGGTQVILAMKEVVKKIPEAILLVIGEKNKYAEEMLGEAKVNGINEELVFTGWLYGDDLKAAFYAADVVLVPSICFDSLPTVVLEGMACRKPVIATCFGGAREIIVDGVTGYIVGPNDSDLLATKVLDLLKNPKKCEEFGANGFKKVSQDFSLARQINEYLSLYVN